MITAYVLVERAQTGFGIEDRVQTITTDPQVVEIWKEGRVKPCFDEQGNAVDYSYLFIKEYECEEFPS